MEEQQIEPIKPFFGPPMSPEIFANKWYEKFCNLLNRHYLRPMQQAERNPVWMCELATLGVVHIRQFFSEALELSLKHKDYPSKGGPAISENQLPPWPLRTADDLLKSMRENPVEQAQFVTFRVDKYAWQLERVKLGSWMYGLPSWQSLPFRWRQTMNDVFLLIEEGRRAGWWCVPEFTRERLVELYMKADGRVG